MKDKKKETLPVDMVDRIVAYEAGEMDEEAVVRFFQDLVDSGLGLATPGRLRAHGPDADRWRVRADQGTLGPLSP